MPLPSVAALERLYFLNFNVILTSGTSNVDRIIHRRGAKKEMGKSERKENKEGVQEQRQSPN